MAYALTRSIDRTINVRRSTELKMSVPDMNTFFCTLAAMPLMVRQSLAIMLERWLIGYLTWRLERLAVAQLWQLSDRALKDIGITRTEVTSVGRGDETRKSRLAGIRR